MHTLTIAPATASPIVVTDHTDRDAALAALWVYLTDADCHPISNQITVDHESYDLICLAQQRRAATATIEPTPTVATTDPGHVTDAELDWLDADAPACLEVRPGTLGFQLCWREDHHHGDHKSQDGQTWRDQ